MLTQTELKELLIYFPDTGIFVWKHRNGRRNACGTVGSVERNGYLRATVNYERWLLHRLAWVYVNGEIPVGMEIDHINGVKTDNRIDNLRVVSKKLNLQNQRKAQCGTKSGFLGVTERKYGYEANILVNGKPMYLGRYKTAQEAHEVYLTAKRKYHKGCTI